MAEAGGASFASLPLERLTLVKSLPFAIDREARP
jgi:hypothetical protein